jgi:hypothetical protein
MGTLEEELQKIHDAKIGVCITWLWDGGVDMRLVDEKGALVDDTNVEKIADILPWVEVAVKKHFPKANYQRGYQTAADKLRTELQKIYDSEINIEISWLGDRPITVKLGNEFYGFDPQVTVSKISEVLPWLEQAIHERYFMSKYDMERRGGEFTPEMAEIRYER